MSDREAFEKWWTERYTDHKLGQIMSITGELTGIYKDPRAELSWLAWQAAQAQTLLEVIRDDSDCPTEVRIAQAGDGWQPIDTAPTDNERGLYLARFVNGELVELDFNGAWEYWEESWEMSHINGWAWVSANGIEEPTHWAYQDQAMPQAQASKPIAAVTGWYDGRCVIEPLDRALAIPVGMALYTTPPAAKINQQLPEGYVLVPVEPTEAMIDAGVAVAFAASVHGKGGWNNYMKALYRAFIAAAQEQSK